MTEELYHHGVKGQKWGERRYQNPDGTLTELGKERLRQYREKELNKLDKKYDKRTDKYQKKYENSTKENKKAFYERMINDIAYDKSVETKFLKELTFEEMTKEKKRSRKSLCKSGVSNSWWNSSYKYCCSICRGWARLALYEFC